MGMRSQAINDPKISASSSASKAFHPKYGRLDLQLGGGGWCALEQNTEQYLQIQLFETNWQSSCIISAMATQGVLTKQSWVKSYYLSFTYTLFDNSKWTFFHDSDKIKVTHAAILSI